MALSNYSDLQAKIASYVSRSDVAASSEIIADAIVIAEAEISRELISVNHPLLQNEATVQTVAGEAEVDQPTGFVSLVSAGYIGDGTEISVVPFHIVLNTNLKEGQDQPTAISIHPSGKFYFAPTPDSAYDVTVIYNSKLPDLATNMTNWLLTEQPDLYLHYTLKNVFLLLQDGEAAAAYATLAEGAMARAKQQVSQRRSGSIKSMKVTSIV